MTSPDEVRDSAVLLDILEWISTMRGDPNAQFVMDVRVSHMTTKEIVMPVWLLKQMLNDLQIYVTDELQERGVDLPPPKIYGVITKTVE